MTGVADSVENKLFIGPRLRRLRREFGLTQARMAEELDISPSYLNLIERGQRPATAQFLIKLAGAYDVDIRALASDTEHQALGELREVFSDPVFAGGSGPVPQQELRDLTEHSPSVADAVLRLYQAYNSAKLSGDRLAGAVGAGNGSHAMAGSGGAHALHNPMDQIRDMIRAANNHYPELDQIAEDLFARFRQQDDEIYAPMRRHLREERNIDVRVIPEDVMRGELRRFDRHRKRLMLSELMEPAGRSFQVAYHLAFTEAGKIIDDLVARAALEDPVTKRLARVAFGNYFAGALMMPYGRFLDAAETLGYDIDILCQRFGASYEQVAHRLTTLQRPTARGIPFFFIRLDNAGNISKRFSSGKFHFSKFGGTCPLWNVHSTFIVPGKILTQIVEMPDGVQYFSLARTVRRAITPYCEPEPQLAIGLGCELRYAHRLVYAKGQNLDTPNPTPIGINCQLCDRPDCRQRAAPPLTKTLDVDEHRRGVSPYSFVDETA
jgi:predicted transcriptional regulator/DNA-binding XRE family transcriptional regulator